MPKPAGIVLFVYNRAEHTRATLEALAQNNSAKDSNLYVFCDGPKRPDQLEKVLGARRAVAEAAGFKNIRVTESAENKGLARSIIAGVTEAFRTEERLIVLEDDIVTSLNFLDFMNSALERYSGDRSVYSISGFQFPLLPPEHYPYDAYFSYRASSWGWATWKDRWQGVDWSVADYPVFRRDGRSRRQFNRGGDDLAPMLDHQMEGKIDSWAIRWAYAHFKAGAYCLFPVRSRVKNIGFDGSGTHRAMETVFESDEPLSDSKGQLRFPPSGEVSQSMLSAVKAFHSMPMRAKVKSWLKRFIF